MFNKIIAKLDSLGLLYEIIDIAHGKQIKLSNGTTVNIYNTDKVLVQGKADKVNTVKQLLGLL